MMSLDGLRNVITTSFIVIDVLLVISFLIYLVPKIQHEGWRHNLGIQAAVALGIYFFGTTISRVWGWMVLHRIDGYFRPDTFWLPLTGSMIALIGALCCIRIFSPQPVRNWLWIAALIAIVAFVVATNW